MTFHMRELGLGRMHRDDNHTMGMFACLNFEGIWMVLRNAEGICERKTLFQIKKKRIKSGSSPRERGRSCSCGHHIPNTDQSASTISAHMHVPDL